MRWVDFGSDRRPTVAMTWGDLITAYRSTRIPDIEIYFEATMAGFMGVTANQYFGWMFRSPWAKAWFDAYMSTIPEGPSAQERERGRGVVVAEAWSNGRRAGSRITTPEVYTFTGISAVAIVKRVLDDAFVPGFQTPSTFLGPDFVLSLDGVVREDIA